MVFFDSYKFFQRFKHNLKTLYPAQSDEKLKSPLSSVGNIFALKYLKNLTTTIRKYKEFCINSLIRYIAPDPTSNFESTNPNFHDCFHQLKQVLLALFVYFILLFFHQKHVIS